MKKLDEISIIKIFQENLVKKKFVSEDVEFFTIGKTKLIAKTDTLVESTDIPPKMKLFDVSTLESNNLIGTGFAGNMGLQEKEESEKYSEKFTQWNI